MTCKYLDMETYAYKNNRKVFPFVKTQLNRSVYYDIYCTLLSLVHFSILVDRVNDIMMLMKAFSFETEHFPISNSIN